MVEPKQSSDEPTQLQQHPTLASTNATFGNEQLGKNHHSSSEPPLSLPSNLVTSKLPPVPQKGTKPKLHKSSSTSFPAMDEDGEIMQQQPEGGQQCRSRSSSVPAADHKVPDITDLRPRGKVIPSN